MTNAESYESFMETCSEDVKIAMKKHSEEMVVCYENRKAGANKEQWLKYAKEILPNKFPSQTWWLEKRPREVKPMHNHTTGLCKVISKNYISICLIVTYLSN